MWSLMLYRNMSIRRRRFLTKLALSTTLLNAGCSQFQRNHSTDKYVEVDEKSIKITGRYCSTIPPKEVSTVSTDWNNEATELSITGTIPATTECDSVVFSIYTTRGREGYVILEVATQPPTDTCNGCSQTAFSYTASVSFTRPVEFFRFVHIWHREGGIGDELVLSGPPDGE